MTAPSTPTHYINIGEKMALKITGITNYAGTYQNNLTTIRAQLIDRDATSIGTELTLAYVASSNGDYLVEVPETITVLCNDGEEYYLTVYSTSGGILNRSEPFTARIRGFSSNN